MSVTNKELIESFTALHPVFFAEYKNTEAFWDPEELPLTTLLGDLGGATARHWDEFIEEDRLKIFQTIEDSVAGEDTLFSEAVATGFLEGIESIAHTQGNWKKIYGYLGKESQKHLDHANYVR